MPRSGSWRGFLAFGSTKSRAALASSLACVGATAWTRSQLSRNDALLDGMLSRATAAADTAVAWSKQLGVPPGVSIAILAKAETLLDHLAELGRDAPRLHYRKAAMHVEFARSYAGLGQDELQWARATQADRLMRRLAAEAPDDLGWQRNLSVGYDALGNLLHAQGRLDEALASYRAGGAIAADIAALDPRDTEWQRRLAVSHVNIGDILRSQGDLSGALAEYQAKRAVTRRLAGADPANADWQYELGAIAARIGLVLETAGDFIAAGAEYEDCLLIGSRFAASFPADAGWQRDLAISHGRLASVHQRLGRTHEAMAELRKGRRIITALVDAAPNAVQWTADLAWLDDQIGALEGRTFDPPAAPPCPPACAEDRAQTSSAVVLAGDRRDRPPPGSR